MTFETRTYQIEKRADGVSVEWDCHFITNFLLLQPVSGLDRPKGVYTFGASQNLWILFKGNTFVAPHQTPSLEGQGFFCEGDHSLAENEQV
jgi:hypothetical protein